MADKPSDTTLTYRLLAQRVILLSRDADDCLCRRIAGGGMNKGSNIGHGHVFPRADGAKARCGGPALCRECARDLAWAEARMKVPG